MNNNILRQIVIDTETTGINNNKKQNKKHRIIEIGAVEIINRRLTGKYFHVYLNPNRMIDQEAFNIHGISNEFLLDKPIFADIADDFFNFICNSELIMHNAQFDINFINYEFYILLRNIPKINDVCSIIDTLQLARKIFPGKQNSLDALCNRYSIDNSKRIAHSALLDARLLAKVFLLMTSSQTSICFDMDQNQYHKSETIDGIIVQKVAHKKIITKIIYANNQEILEHERLLDFVQKRNNKCLWR